ncbi:hypothetical protein LTR37_020248 [Vermiconidia calcicola]|uniref:Uncharacterized protein n=1 Tax=Vermiconidia calcicola TaxID=1690605 RepID=A0ACC3MBR5_9PEZI|nr:hypothetical protein LTR37_020248 [Vermiconidia calcicola]
MSAIQTILPIFQTVVIISLAFMAGIAASLRYWVIPTIMHRENTSRNEIAQFDATIRLGEKYLMPSSRILMASLLSLGALTALHPDSAVAAKWKYHAVAGVVLIQAAWWEIVFIFPINAEVRAMGEKFFGGNGDQSLPEGEQKKLNSLLTSWNNWHVGRIVTPLLAAIISLAGVI